MSQITRLPRYLSGQKEHEVELQFSSAMISFPDRLKDDQVAADGEKLPEYHSETGSQITPSSRESLCNISVYVEFLIIFKRYLF